MNIKETGYAPGIPVFRHDAALRTLPGGFVLDTTAFPDGAEIPAGTAITVDEAARTATPVRTAVLAEAYKPSDPALRIEKGHHIATGDKLDGKTVTSIDTSPDGHDAVKLSGAPAALPAGAKLGTGDGNALTLHAVRVERGSTHPVDAVTGGTVYQRRIGHISEQTKKNLPNVTFTDSK